MRSNQFVIKNFSYNSEDVVKPNGPLYSCVPGEQEQKEEFDALITINVLSSVTRRQQTTISKIKRKLNKYKACLCYLLCEQVY